jgi:hypothetical protein
MGLGWDASWVDGTATANATTTAKAKADPPPSAKDDN